MKKDFESEHGFNKSPPETEVEIVLIGDNGTYTFHDNRRAARFLTYHTQLDAAQVQFLLNTHADKIGQFTVERFAVEWRNFNG